MGSWVPLFPHSVDKLGCHSPRTQSPTPEPPSLQLSSIPLLIFLDLKHWLCAHFTTVPVTIFPIFSRPARFIFRARCELWRNRTELNWTELKLQCGIGTQSVRLFAFLIDSLPKTVNAFLYFCFSFGFEFDFDGGTSSHSPHPVFYGTFLRFPAICLSCSRIVFARLHSRLSSQMPLSPGFSLSGL